MATPPPSTTSGSTGQHQHAFKGLADWVEVFRAGTHTDSKGRVCSFAEADLDQMAANVATLGAPPAVLGHPKHNDPAYAWANEVKRDGASLYAKFSDVNPAFAAGVESGAYRNRSVSIIKDKAHGWRLQHIGWLGAAPPAIDGLKPVEFTADDQVEAHEFGADDLTTSFAIGDIASVLRGLRDWVISKDGLDVADRVLPSWTLDSITSSAARIREQALAEDAAEASGGMNPLYTSQQTGAVTMPFTQEDLDRVRIETEARMRAEAAAQQVQFTATQAGELQALKAERQAERIAGHIGTWKAAGQLLPAEEPGLAEFMAALEGEGGSNAFEFTAAGAAPVKKTRAEWFTRFMAGRKPLVKLGARQAGDETAGEVLDTADPAAIAHQAREYQAAEAAKGHTIAIDQAVTAVMARAAKGA